MFTVTTASGFKMILENAGEDSQGNRLWRQVSVGLGRTDKTQEEERDERA